MNLATVRVAVGGGTTYGMFLLETNHIKLTAYTLGVWGMLLKYALKVFNDPVFSYHSVKDPRIPASFTCFDCRVRADPSWELIKINLYPKMLSKFQELALFR